MTEPVRRIITGDTVGPVDATAVPRYGGEATFARLPRLQDVARADVAILGVPFDSGVSYRPGARFGPSHIRESSRLLRPYNPALQVPVFAHQQVADAGDLAVNPFSIDEAIQAVELGGRALLEQAPFVLTLGGDHTIALPILRAIHRKHGKVGLIHVDAHADVNDTMMGEKIAHGTPFRRAVEEGLLDCERVVQIGLRGTGYAADDFDWCRDQGFEVVQAEACWNQSLAPLMARVRERMGDAPVYITFDIDGIDPAFAPGTGTPEIAGLTVPQALEIIRGSHGLNIVGCDLVEVAPPYDPFGTTALLGANLAFELLCVLPGVEYRAATR
jgi:guanidinobutyrase